MWEKKDTPDEKIHQLQVAPAGSGEHRSKRLRIEEKRDSAEETTQKITPQTAKLSVWQENNWEKESMTS